MRTASRAAGRSGGTLPGSRIGIAALIYDDGTPRGSEQNDECRIDALAQAWTVISKAAPRERAGQAMETVEMETVEQPLRSPQRSRSSAS